MDRKRGALVAGTGLCAASVFVVFWAVWGLPTGLLGGGVAVIGAGVGAAVVSLLNSSLTERN